jgi:hypothetical protein
MAHNGSALLGVEMVRGRDETVSFIFEQIPEGIENFTAIADHVRELPGDRVLSIGRYGGRGTSSGAKVEVSSASVYRFDSGVIVFFRDFPTMADALKAGGWRSRPCRRTSTSCARSMRRGSQVKYLQSSGMDVAFALGIGRYRLRRTP